MVDVALCGLCGTMSKLRKSHIWSQLAYKRYVSDKKAGGRFDDLQSLRRHNRQPTDYLLCDSCERKFEKFETPTARLLDSVTANATGDVVYGEYLLPFAVSLSWRVANYYLPRAIKPEYGAILRPAMKRWRDWLLMRKRTIGPYTQHAFISFDEDHEPDCRFHECLGGEVFYAEGLLLSRLGPLIVVAFLNRNEMPLEEVRAWEISEIRPGGGKINRISKHERHPAVTSRLAAVLDRHEWHVLEQGARLARKSRRRLTTNTLRNRL